MQPSMALPEQVTHEFTAGVVPGSSNFTAITHAAINGWFDGAQDRPALSIQLSPRRAAAPVNVRSVRCIPGLLQSTDCNRPDAITRSAHAL